MSYLKIYRNHDTSPYTHTVLKGDELYNVRLHDGEIFRWKYKGKINPQQYQINGTLISKPSIKMISILQKNLKPSNVHESLDESRYVYRSTSQKWLSQFIDQHGFIDHKHKFISFSFDPNSGGQDNFGGREVVIEFNRDIILRQAEEQGYGKVYYDEDWMEEHSDVCMHITGYKSKKDYYQDNEVLDDEEAYNKTDMLTWEMMLDDFSNEEEIVLKKLQDEEGLINQVIFHEPANNSLVNKLKRKNIPYKLNRGLENDLQYTIDFNESAQNKHKSMKLIQESLDEFIQEKNLNEKKKIPKTKKEKEQKFSKTMKEWKKGDLSIGTSNKKVPKSKKGQQQAIAIALSQTGQSKKS